MPKLRISDGIVKDDILVIGLAHKNTGANSKNSLVIESGDVAVDVKKLQRILSDFGATGKADEITKVPGSSSGLIVFTGLGEQKSGYGSEVLRRAAGCASRALAGSSSATFALPVKNEEDLLAVTEGAGLGTYVFDEFRQKSKSDRKSPLKSATVQSKKFAKSSGTSVAARAQITVDYTNLVRDLINTPPSHLNPETFVKAVQSAVKKSGASGLKISVLTQTQLKSKGYGGIVAVGQGSKSPPRLLQISYTPTNSIKGKKSLKKYAFVGKGITFDTGGLALKPALGMESMKADMSGAAAVCAATIAIALLKLPIEIHTYAPLAENMVSENATRPGDIITMYGGKTVEVLNPDAEGRLVLGDALVKAQEDHKLDAIIDVATLTGAQVVALGTRTSAVMTNNEDLQKSFLKAAQDCGEAFWPMPLPIELRASLDSPVADLANIGERMGGMLVAGLFLKEFISEDLPWLHLDIAGPAFNEKKAHGYTPVGGTGVALRSLVALAESASQ